MSQLGESIFWLIFLALVLKLLSLTPTFQGRGKTSLYDMIQQRRPPGPVCTAPGPHILPRTWAAHTRILWNEPAARP